jgi:hypothetical protein
MATPPPRSAALPPWTPVSICRWAIGSDSCLGRCGSSRGVRRWWPRRWQPRRRRDLAGQTSPSLLCVLRVGLVDPLGPLVSHSSTILGEHAGYILHFRGLILKRVSEMNFQKLLKWFRKSYLEKYGSKNYETNFVVILMTRSTV